MVQRLRSDLQVAAIQRAVEAEGLIFTVLHKGHEEGGLIHVKWVEGRMAQLFQERTVADERRWVASRPAPAMEAEVDGMIAGERDFDPDLWAVEVLGPLHAAERILRPVPVAT